MSVISMVWHDVLTLKLPTISLTDNPRVDPFAVGSIALTFALALLHLVRTRQPATLRSLGFTLPVIVLAWLAFTTPAGWLFGFAPNGATTIAAWVVHGVLALLPLALVIIWLVQLGLSPLSLPGIGIELGACALLVAGIELQGWPGDLVAVLETLLSVVIFAGLAIAAAKIIHHHTALRGLAMFAIGLWGAALTLVLFAHTIHSPLVALCLLFLAIICLDGMMGTGLWRFVVTVPLVLVAGVLGAANVFAPYSRAPGLSSSIWLEAAGAGAVFLFVAPLFDWTQQQLRHRLDLVRQRVLADQRAERDLAFARKQRHLAQRVLDQITGQEAVSAAQLERLSRQRQADEQRLQQITPLARRLVTELDGISAAFFFFVLIAYYLLVAIAAYLPDPVPLLRPIAGATLITVVGLVLNQAITSSVVSARAFKAAPDDVLRRQAFAPVRRIASIFLPLVLMVYGLGGQLGSVITLGDCSDPGKQSCVLIDQLNGLTHTAGVAPLALLGNGNFWIAAGRIVLGVALVLLAIGQWRFITVVRKTVNAVKTAEEGNTPARAGAGAETATSTDKDTTAPPAQPATAQTHSPQSQPVAVAASASTATTSRER